MDETDTLRQLLRASADEAGDWPEPTSAAALAAHRRRRRRAVAGAGLAVVTVVAVAVPVAVSTSHRRTTASSLIGPTVDAAASAVLPGGRWTTLPTAPIAGRSYSATAWTGTQMLIWGGSDQDGNTEYADGAAYDPARRTWQKLPPSPLSARVNMTSVWTGKSWFIWGGGGPDLDRSPDGALYDPVARRWTKLPEPPVTEFSTVQAYWTGRQVLLLSIPGHNVNHLVLQALDPSTQTWTRLPDLKLRPKHDGQEVGAVVAGSTFYVWSEWAHTVQIAPNGTETTPGIDAYSFDLTRRQWSPRHFNPPVDRSVRDPVWTGHDILVPPAERWCGSCAGPFDPHPTGAQVDPQSRSVRTIASGPVDNEGGPYFWTGAVLLAGAGTAYWTPTTGRWTALPRAPLTGYGTATVWTGRSLLVWGQLSPSGHPSAKPTSAGIELR